MGILAGEKHFLVIMIPVNVAMHLLFDLQMPELTGLRTIVTAPRLQR